MRQAHLAGDKLFVDYAGDKLGVVIDRRTGERRAAHIFVAVMGASSLSFACATWTETLADWTDAHVPSFATVGGALRLLVTDHEQDSVIKACLYEQQVNTSHDELARHYGNTCPPCWPSKLSDTAQVRGGEGGE